MIPRTATRLANTPRRVIGFTRAGITAGEEAARQLGDAVRRIDAAVNDVHAMRQIAERLDERVANLQQQVNGFDTRIAHVERVADVVAEGTEKVTDRLPDPNEGTIHKLKSALSGTPPGDESD
jgi:ABC-type nitrate/sulfonate/bicarbonate transport system substrate-binding protein